MEILQMMNSRAQRELITSEHEQCQEACDGRQKLVGRPERKQMHIHNYKHLHVWRLAHTFNYKK